MPSLTDELNRLMDVLDGGMERQPAAGDAIDRILASPRRRTDVRTLRNDPVVEAFRRELVDGLIRVDTANKLLHLVNAAVTALLTR